MRDSDEEQIRIDLAATFRIIAHLGMHEAVANHFSAALSADGKTFLLNPKWKHFSRIRASDLLVLHADDERCAARPDVDATAWAIHGQIHQRLPDVRVVLHLHPVYTTSLACLATPQILPIDQNTARYFNRVAVDTLYGGMADTAAEGARLAGLLTDKRRLLMGNHGVLVTAPTIGEAFDDIWTLERACQILITAWSTGQPLKVLSLWSHWQDGRFTGSVDDEVVSEQCQQPEACFGPSGSVCFMHTRLLHASSPNETEQPRTLFISVYAAEDALPFGENPLPSLHAGQLVAGVESGLVRSAANQLRLPQKPRGASFFVQQAGHDLASM